MLVAVVRLLRRNVGVEGHEVTLSNLDPTGRWLMHRRCNHAPRTCNVRSHHVHVVLPLEGDDAT
eukprot:10440072-Alexandrium_andersonii.AAC.1